MLQKLSLLIKRCLDEAAEAREQAAAAEDPDTRRGFQVLEHSWDAAARTQDLVERLEPGLRHREGVKDMLWQRTEAQNEAVKREPKVPGTPLIAIVEDDAGVRASLKRLVCSFGYLGSTFASAEEYLVSDLVCDTACLISDVQLPGMSGPDLQARLAADGHEIPIVFVTGFFSESVRARTLAAGAVGYFAKPFDAATLIGCLEKALASKPS
jgi:CheY-like chemotaxis protein